MTEQSKQEIKERKARRKAEVKRAKINSEYQTVSNILIAASLMATK